MRIILCCLLAALALRPIGAMAQASLSAYVGYSLDTSAGVATGTTTPGQTISLNKALTDSSGYGLIRMSYGTGVLTTRATTSNPTASAYAEGNAYSNVADVITVTSGTLPAGTAVSVTATLQIAGTTTCAQTDIVGRVKTTKSTCTDPTTLNANPVYSCPTCVVTVTGQSAPTDLYANAAIAHQVPTNYNQVSLLARLTDLTVYGTPFLATPDYAFLGTGSFGITDTVKLTLIVGHRYEVSFNSYGLSEADAFPTNVTVATPAASASMTISKILLTFKRAATNFSLTTASGALYGQ